MWRIEHRTVINRPVEVAWDFMTDLSNSSKWTQSGSELHLTSSGPLGIGSTIESRRRVFGRFDIKSQSLVLTEVEANHAFSYTGKVALIRNLRSRFLFEPTDGATLMTWSSEGELVPAVRWLQPAFDRLVRWGQGIEVANIKRLVEAAPDRAPVAVP
jgi:Polyketide cyclase / dehydrase and lipid transport